MWSSFAILHQSSWSLQDSRITCEEAFGDEQDQQCFILILTNAAFDCRQELNHWVPALRRGQVDDHLFNSLQEMEATRSDLRCSELLVVVRELEQKYAAARECGKDTELELGQLMSAQDEWLHACNWVDFQRRCQALDLQPFKAQAHGNCLARSLKRLIEMDFVDEPEAEAEQDIEAVQLLRKDLSDAWLTLKKIPSWQQLFRVMILGDQEEAALPSTPSPKVNHEIHEKDTHPMTPPNPNLHGKKADPGKKQPKIIEEAEKHPSWKRQRKNITLEGPNQKPPAPPARNPAEDLEVPECLQIVKAEQEATDVAEKRRTRQWKKRPKSKREIYLKNLRKYLSQRGISWQRWSALHWADVKSKKAGCCQDGLYTTFQGNLLDECAGGTKIRSCKVCDKMLQDFGFKHDEAENALEHGCDPWSPGCQKNDVEEMEPDDVNVPEDQEENPDQRMNLATLARSVSIHLEAGDCLNHCLNLSKPP